MKRGTVVRKVDFAGTQQGGVLSTLDVEVNEYLNAPPLVSGYLLRQTEDADGKVKDELERWWCQLKGPFIMQWEDNEREVRGDGSSTLITRVQYDDRPPKVGDRVEVRDGTQDWRLGTVTEVVSAAGGDVDKVETSGSGARIEISGGKATFIYRDDITASIDDASRIQFRFGKNLSTEDKAGTTSQASRVAKYTSTFSGSATKDAEGNWRSSDWTTGNVEYAQALFVDGKLQCEWLGGEKQGSAPTKVDGFSLKVLKDGSEESFIWEEWQWPAEFAAVPADGDGIHVKRYDLVVASTFDASKDDAFSHEDQMEYSTIPRHNGQSLMRGTKVERKNDRGELELKVEGLDRPLSVGTRIQRRRGSGAWEEVGTVHIAHFDFQDSSWHVDEPPDVVIDLRFMNYAERIPAAVGDNRGIVLHSFSNNASKLYMLAYDEEKLVKSLDDWESSLKKVIHNLKTAFLSVQQRVTIFNQGHRGILDEGDQDMSRWLIGNPLLPPSCYTTISKFSSMPDTDGSSGEDEEVITVTVQLPPELLRPLKGEGRYVWERMRKRKDFSALAIKFESDDDKIKAAFDEVDDDGSGALDLDEVKKLCVRLGTKANPEELREAMDSNGDGSVDFKEFKEWWRSLVPSSVETVTVRKSKKEGELTYKDVRAAVEAHLIDLSQTRDFELVKYNPKAAGIDGWIFADDITKIPVPVADLIFVDTRTGRIKSDSGKVRSGKEEWNDEKIEAAFKKADGDGSGTLEFEELESVCEALSTTFGPAEIMAELDEDGDEKITFEEFKKWWLKRPDIELRVDMKGSFLLMHLLDLDWHEAATRSMAERLHEHRNERDVRTMLEIGVLEGLRPIMEERLIEWWRLKLNLRPLETPKFENQLTSAEIQEQKASVSGIDRQSGIIAQDSFIVDETVYSCNVPEADIGAPLKDLVKERPKLLNAGILAAQGEEARKPGAILTTIVGSDGRLKMRFAAREAFRYNPHTYGLKRILIMVGEVVVFDREVTLLPPEDLRPCKKFHFFDGTNNASLSNVKMKFSDGTNGTVEIVQNGSDPISFPADKLSEGEVQYSFEKDGFMTMKPESALFLKKMPHDTFKKNILVDKKFLSPKFDDSKSADFFRIILSWNEKPSDLDIYIKNTNGTTVYYSNKSGDGMDLDTDATHGFGPETITLNRKAGVQYIVWVCHCGTPSQAENIRSSNAKLNLSSSSTSLSLTVPRSHNCSDEPKYWRAFGIDEGGFIVRFGTGGGNGVLVNTSEEASAFFSQGQSGVSYSSGSAEGNRGARSASDLANASAVDGFSHEDYEEGLDDAGSGDIFSRQVNDAMEKMRQQVFLKNLIGKIEKMDNRALAASCPVVNPRSIPSTATSSSIPKPPPGFIFGSDSTNPYEAMMQILTPEQLNTESGISTVSDMIFKALVGAMPAEDDLSSEEQEGSKKNAASTTDANAVPSVERVAKILFLINATGSMDYAINDLKLKITDIVDKAERTQFEDISIRFGIVCYRHYGESEPFVIHDFTADKKYFKSKLSEIAASGGGDTAVDVLGGMDKALTAVSWDDKESDNALTVSKVLFHMGDAPAHGSEFYDADDVSDNHPENSAVPRPHTEICRAFANKKIDYYFAKLKGNGGSGKVITEVMAEKFRAAYDANEGKSRNFTIVNLTSYSQDALSTEVSTLLTKSVETSLADAVGVRSKTERLLEKEVKYACWNEHTRALFLDAIQQKDVGLLLTAFFGQEDSSGSSSTSCLGTSNSSHLPTGVEQGGEGQDDVEEGGGGGAQPMWERVQKNDDGRVEDSACWDVVLGDRELCKAVGNNYIDKGKAMLLALKQTRDKMPKGKQLDESGFKELYNPEELRKQAQRIDSESHLMRISKLKDVLLPVIIEHVAKTVPSTLGLTKADSIKQCSGHVRNFCKNHLSFPDIIMILGDPKVIIPIAVKDRSIRPFIDERAAIAVCDLLSKAIPERLLRMEQEAADDDDDIWEEEDEDEENEFLDREDQDNITKAFGEVSCEDLILCIRDSRHAFSLKPLMMSRHLKDTRGKLCKVAVFYFIEGLGMLERAKDLDLEEVEMLEIATELTGLLVDTCGEDVDADVVDEKPVSMEEDTKKKGPVDPGAEEMEKDPTGGAKKDPTEPEEEEGDAVESSEGDRESGDAYPAPGGALTSCLSGRRASGKNSLALLLQNPFSFLRFVLRRLHGSPKLKKTRMHFRKICAALLVSKMKEFFGVEQSDFEATGGDPTSNMIHTFHELIAPLSGDNDKFNLPDPSNVTINRASFVAMRDAAANATDALSSFSFDISQCLSFGSGTALKLLKKVAEKIFATIKGLLVPKFVAKMQLWLKFAKETATALKLFLMDYLTIPIISKGIQLIVAISTGFGAAAAPQMLTSFILTSFSEEIASVLRHPLTEMIVYVSRPILRWSSDDCVTPSQALTEERHGGKKYELVLSFLDDGLAQALKFVGLCLEVPPNFIALICFVTKTVLSRKRLEEVYGKLRIGTAQLDEEMQKIEQSARDGAVRCLRSSLRLSAHSAEKMKTAMNKLDFTKMNDLKFDLQGGSTAAITDFLANSSVFSKDNFPDLHAAARSMVMRDIQLSIVLPSLPKFRVGMKSMPTMPTVQMPRLGSTRNLANRLKTQSMADLTKEMSNRHKNAQDVKSRDHKAELAVELERILVDVMDLGTPEQVLGEKSLRRFRYNTSIFFMKRFIRRLRKKTELWEVRKLAVRTFGNQDQWPEEKMQKEPVVVERDNNALSPDSITLRENDYDDDDDDDDDDDGDAGGRKERCRRAMLSTWSNVKYCCPDPRQPTTWIAFYFGLPLVASLVLLLKFQWSWQMAFAPLFGAFGLIVGLIVVAAMLFGVYVSGKKMIKCLRLIYALPREEKRKYARWIAFAFPFNCLVLWIMLYGLTCTNDDMIEAFDDFQVDQICSTSASWFLPLIVVSYGYTVYGFLKGLSMLPADEEPEREAADGTAPPEVRVSEPTYSAETKENISAMLLTVFGDCWRWSGLEKASVTTVLLYQASISFIVMLVLKSINHSVPWIITCMPLAGATALLIAGGIAVAMITWTRAWYHDLANPVHWLAAGALTGSLTFLAFLVLNRTATGSFADWPWGLVCSPIVAYFGAVAYSLIFFSASWLFKKWAEGKPKLAPLPILITSLYFLAAVAVFVAFLILKISTSIAAFKSWEVVFSPLYLSTGAFVGGMILLALFAAVFILFRKFSKNKAALLAIVYVLTAVLAFIVFAILKFAVPGSGFSSWWVVASPLLGAVGFPILVAALIGLGFGFHCAGKFSWAKMGEASTFLSTNRKEAMEKAEEQRRGRLLHFYRLNEVDKEKVEPKNIFERKSGKASVKVKGGGELPPYVIVVSGRDLKTLDDLGKRAVCRENGLRGGGQRARDFGNVAFWTVREKNTDEAKAAKSTLGRFYFEVPTLADRRRNRALVDAQEEEEKDLEIEKEGGKYTMLDAEDLPVAVGVIPDDLFEGENALTDDEKDLICKGYNTEMKFISEWMWKREISKEVHANVLLLHYHDQSCTEACARCFFNRDANMRKQELKETKIDVSNVYRLKKRTLPITSKGTLPDVIIVLRGRQLKLLDLNDRRALCEQVRVSALLETVFWTLSQRNDDLGIPEASLLTRFYREDRLDLLALGECMKSIGFGFGVTSSPSDGAFGEGSVQRASMYEVNSADVGSLQAHVEMEQHVVNPFDFAGYFEKQSSTTKQWEKKWFELNGPWLRYWPSRVHGVDTYAAIDVRLLVSAQVVRGDDVGKNQMLLTSKKGREIHLRVTSRRDGGRIAEWCLQIQHTLESWSNAKSTVPRGISNAHKTLVAISMECEEYSFPGADMWSAAFADYQEQVQHRRVQSKWKSAGQAGLGKHRLMLRWDRVRKETFRCGHEIVVARLEKERQERKVHFMMNWMKKELRKQDDLETELTAVKRAAADEAVKKKGRRTTAGFFMAAANIPNNNAPPAAARSTGNAEQGDRSNDVSSRGGRTEMVAPEGGGGKAKARQETLSSGPEGSRPEGEGDLTEGGDGGDGGFASDWRISRMARNSESRAFTGCSHYREDPKAAEFGICECGKPKEAHPKAAFADLNRSHNAQSGAGSVRFEDFLEKKGGGTSFTGRRQWAKRWFEVHDDVVTYYKGKKGGKLAGQVQLFGSRVESGTTPTDKGHHWLNIHTRGGRTLQVRSTSEELITKFKEAITAASAGRDNE